MTTCPSASAASGRAGRRPVDAELPHRLVGDDDGAGRGRGREQHPPGGVGHRRAGGVVQLGHDVGERRGRAADRGVEHALVPAAADVDGDRHESGSGLAEGLVGVRVGRRLDQDGVAAADQHPGEQGDGVLRADGDDHLGGQGGQTALGVAVGDRGAEARVTDGVVPDPGERRRHVPHRPFDGLGDARGAAERGLPQVEQPLGDDAGQVLGVRSALERQADDAAGAPQRGEVAVRAEPGVGVGDGGA
jgi:hypothetical protein